MSASTACAGPTLLKGTTAAATMQATRMPEAAACDVCESDAMDEEPKSETRDEEGGGESGARRESGRKRGRVTRRAAETSLESPPVRPETRRRAAFARPRALGIEAFDKKKGGCFIRSGGLNPGFWVRAVTSSPRKKPRERGGFRRTHRDERPPQGLVRLLLEGLVGEEHLAVHRGASARGLLGAIVAAARVGETRFGVRSGHRRVVGVARQKRKHLAGAHLRVADDRAVTLAARAVALSHHGGIRFRVSMRGSRARPGMKRAGVRLIGLLLLAKLWRLLLLEAPIPYWLFSGAFSAPATRSETKRCFPPTPLPGHFKERDRAPQSRGVDRRDASVGSRAFVDHVRWRRRVGACALTPRPARIPPHRAATKTRLFFSNHHDLALTSPSPPRGHDPARRVPSRRPSHRQPFGGAGSAPAFGAGSAPAFGAAPAAGAASVRALFFPSRRP